MPEGRLASLRNPNADRDDASMSLSSQAHINVDKLAGFNIRSSFKVSIFRSPIEKIFTQSFHNYPISIHVVVLEHNSLQFPKSKCLHATTPFSPSASLKPSSPLSTTVMVLSLSEVARSLGRASIATVQASMGVPSSQALCHPILLVGRPSLSSSGA